MDNFVSPNELHREACKQMLKGKLPASKDDWALCVNFWACNIAPSLEVSACLLLAKILACPLTDKEIRAIAKFQASKKK